MIDLFINRSVTINIKTATTADDGTTTYATTSSPTIMGSLQSLSSREEFKYQKKMSSTLAKLYIPVKYSDGTAVSVNSTSTITIGNDTWFIIGDPVIDINYGSFYKLIIELHI